MSVKIKLSSLALAMILSACGDSSGGNTYNQVVEQPDPGPVTPTVPSFDGFYTLPNGGYMEIVVDSGNLNDVTQLRLIMANNDGSYALIPLATASNLPIQNSELLYFGSLTYAAANNAKADVGSAVLNGALFTLITMSKTNDTLSIRVQISSGATVVFDHTVSEE